MRRAALSYVAGLLLIGGLAFPQSPQPSPLILTESRPQADAAFGSAMAAGDFNNDGGMDLAVSNTNERVFIFYGRTTLQPTPNVTLSTRETGIDFGIALASGDWNRDGRTDLAIGAPGASNSEDSSFDGQVIIYLGAQNFGRSSVTIRSPLPPEEFVGGYFGGALANGDVDGDGRSDLIVGAWFLDAVVILYGGNTIGARRTTLRGNIDEEYYGFAVAAGDLNKDGLADIAIGAPFGGSTGAGAVYVFLGRKQLSSRPDFVLQNPHPAVGSTDPENPAFASSLAVADLNGDGYADLIVGSPNTSEASRTGRVYIFFGGPTLRDTPDLTLEEPAPQAGSAFGYALATGDLNGDGKNDLAIGAIGASVGGRSRAGRVYIYSGGDTIGPTPTATLDPPTPETGGEFGTALAIGDFNRDGKPDLAVGAPGLARRAGRVLLYLGGIGG